MDHFVKNIVPIQSLAAVQYGQSPVGSKACRTLATTVSMLCAALSGFLFAPGVASAQTWTPMVGGGGKVVSQEVSRSSAFALPKSITARGGVVRAVVVGGGEGGSSARGACEDSTIEGGRGGDGGEVLEVEITLAAGQCSGVLLVTVGEGGRGAFRSGNGAAVGEAGGATTVSCGSTPLVVALGGGRKNDGVTGTKSSKGGYGAVLTSVLEAVPSTDPKASAAADQAMISAVSAADGQASRLEYGSGGGGGGVSVVTSGASARMDGMRTARSVVRHAAAGKGPHGAGSGAGPQGRAPEAAVVPAENASHFGAGGGGGYGSCGINVAQYRDGGHGASGVVKFSWAAD